MMSGFKKPSTFWKCTFMATSRKAKFKMANKLPLKGNCSFSVDQKWKREDRKQKLKCAWGGGEGLQEVRPLQLKGFDSSPPCALGGRWSVKLRSCQGPCALASLFYAVIYWPALAATIYHTELAVTDENDPLEKLSHLSLSQAVN